MLQSGFACSLRSRSSSTPRKRSRSQTRARTSADPSPIPAVNASASRPPIAAAMADTAVRGRFVEFGAEPMATTPDELGRFIAAEVVKWREIIGKAGIRIDQ